MIDSTKTAGLEPFFAPRGIAVIGASDGHERAGARALFNLRHFDYRGAVYPVTRRHAELFGFPCFAAIDDVPDPVDLAVICVGTASVAAAVREVGARGIPAAVIFAGGFTGEREAVRAVRQDLRNAQRETGVRLIGPNTIGTRLVQTGAFATFAHDIEGGLTPGRVAVIAQSGGLGVYFGSSYLRRRGVGTRYLVDTGDEIDVQSYEVIDYVAQDPEVSCIGLILEGARDGRSLARAVRSSVQAGKRIVLLKTGRSAAAAEQVASHTGALAVDAGLFESALRNAGADIVDNETELVDALTIHDAGKAPEGRRLGVVSPSGGYAILTIDAAERYEMQLPAPRVPPTGEQAPHLRSGTLKNPFDYASETGPGEHTLGAAVAWMTAQPDIDAVLLWQAYSLLIPERRRQLDEALSTVLTNARCPLFGCGITTEEHQRSLADRGVLWFEEPTRLVRALSVVAPRPTAAASQTSRTSVPPATLTVVSGAAARKLLGGMDHVETVAVDSADHARALCKAWTSLVLKVESDRHPHKTELGMVSGPVGMTGVDRAYHDLVEARMRHGGADAPIVAQPFEKGVELALGAFRDPTFGPAVMVACGGIYTEILRDTAVAPAPIDHHTAVSLILGLRVAPLLTGARGRPPADVEAAADALVALSQFISEDDGRFQSIDVNPLIVRPAGEGAVAVDAVLIPRPEEG